MCQVIRGTVLGLLSTFILLLMGCAEPTPHKEPPVNLVPIENFQDVEGQWEGMVRRKGQKDWFQVTIREDGSFEAVSRRDFVGTFKSEGRFTLSDGKLLSDTNGAEGTFALYDRNGEVVLRVDAKGRHGFRYRGELARVRP